MFTPLRLPLLLNKQGAILIEQVFVLFTLTVFLTLSPVINRNICENKINLFIKALKNDLNYGMVYSVTHYKIVKVYFYPNENRYKVADAYGNLLKEQKYEKMLVFDSYITHNTIDISHGHVNYSHYFYLSCGNIKYKVNIYEKSGILNATKQ